MTRIAMSDETSGPKRPKRDKAIARLSVFAVVLLTPVLATAACPAIDHDHGAWNTILHQRVRDGRVAYAALQKDDAPLRAYLDDLSATCAADYEGWSREQRLAFWINAYNAFTVQLILDHYPIASIRKIGWLPGAAFRETFIPMPALKRGMISLNDIEHDTLRTDFREPRIHFALVCASRSCPRLRNEAYRASDLDQQLDDQARTFLHDTSKNRFDSKTDTLYLSRIFDWFGADFEAVAGSVPAYVARYLDDPRMSASNVRVKFLEYDWSLNDQATP
jgi:Protein of unknown function, DUF547